MLLPENNSHAIREFFLWQFIFHHNDLSGGTGWLIRKVGAGATEPETAGSVSGVSRHPSCVTVHFHLSRRQWEF